MVKKSKISPLIKLNLASGSLRKDGFLNVDIRKEVKPDICHDLLGGQRWPWKDGSVDEVCCNNLLHLATGEERIWFVSELWRIMKSNPQSDPHGAKALITTPHWANTKAYLDPMAQFPPICESSYAIFNRKWRQDNDYEFAAIKTNFKSPIGWANPHADFIGRNDEYMIHQATHAINAVSDLMVTLFKLPMDVLEL